MKKLLSFTLILALVLSSASFAFAEPDTWAFKSSDTDKLQAYDKSQNRWENSNIKGYKELEYVSMRYVSGDKSVTEYGIEFDYYENGASEKYGFDDVLSEVVFYDSSGNEIEMSGSYDTGITKSTTSGKMIFTIDITDASDLPSEFAMAFEARLAGPAQSSQWSGASLHARLIADGNKEVSIVAPPYGTIEVTKEFTGLERPNEVVIHFDGDSGNYQITLDSSCLWNGMIPNVEPGEYEVSEESIGDYWQAEYTPQTVNVVLEETVQVTVTNTYNPPVTTLGSITFVKEWEGDCVPESGYVNFTVNGEYPFATVEYPSWTTTVEELPFGTYELTDETIFDIGDHSYYRVSGIPQSVELTETTPDAAFTVVNHMNPKTGDVMFHKYFEFVDEGTTPGSVNINWGEADVPITAADVWTKTVPNMPVGQYRTSEDSLGDYWTYEIMYSIGETTPTSIGTMGDIPVEEGETTHVFVYNAYDEPTSPIDNVIIEKSVSPSSHNRGGGPVTYTVTFENTGTETYDAFWVQDQADWFVPEDAFDFTSDMDGDLITTSGDVFFNDGPHDITFEPGSIVTATWKYDSSGLSSGSYSNTVTGTAFNIYCTGVVYPDLEVKDNGNGVYCEYVERAQDTADATFRVTVPRDPDDDDPGVRIEKSVDVDEASVGDTVTYTIKVTNNGDVSLTDVIVIDDLIDVEWDIGSLSKGDSITETFEYVIQEGDFENGEFENIAEVTADSREGSASDTDDAVVEEETIDVPPVTPPETPPEVVVPPAVPPQALPQTGQSGMGLVYGMGSAMLLAGVAFGRKKRQ